MFLPGRDDSRLCCVGLHVDGLGRLELSAEDDPGADGRQRAQEEQGDDRRIELSPLHEQDARERAHDQVRAPRKTGEGGYAFGVSPLSTALRLHTRPSPRMSSFGM
jgi:hypothetical protein